MQYDFDRIIKRKGTNSSKWDILVRDGVRTELERSDDPLSADDILPLWVADMDFAVADPIREALVARAEHAVFGYSAPTQKYYDAIMGWMERRHGWTVEQDWILTGPGVVPSLKVLVQALTEPGDGIVINTPVYHPFYYAIETNERTLCDSPLDLIDGNYEINWADLEARIADPNTTMAILCSPHNPLGRIWTSEELNRYAKLCSDNNVILISDEIHHDLIFSWSKFVPIGVAAPEYMDNIIVCTAPSKTFNVPGLKTSNMFIANKDMRKKVNDLMGLNGLTGTNAFGIIALQTAYAEGDEWLDQAMAYIEGNFLFLKEYLAEHMPQLKVHHPDGTYLIWVDCTALGLDADDLHKRLFDDAKVWLSPGKQFGAAGGGYMRFNIACPRATLEEALRRICAVEW